MGLFGWGEKSEPVVGVADALKFRDDICRLEPAAQAKMLQDMASAGHKDAKLPSVIIERGILKFPGQFTIGVSGDAHDNNFKLGAVGADKTINIVDAHNNKVVVECPPVGAAVQQDAARHGATDLPAAGAAAAEKASPLSYDQILRKYGIDPDSLVPKGGHPDTHVPLPADAAPQEMVQKLDIELPNKSHIVIEQQGDAPPKVTAPKDVGIKSTKDGGFDVSFDGRTFHEHNGGISSDGDLNGVKLNSSSYPAKLGQ